MREKILERIGSLSLKRTLKLSGAVSLLLMAVVAIASYFMPPPVPAQPTTASEGVEKVRLVDLLRDKGVFPIVIDTAKRQLSIDKATISFLLDTVKSGYKKYYIYEFASPSDSAKFIPYFLVDSNINLNSNSGTANFLDSFASISGISYDALEKAQLAASNCTFSISILHGLIRNMKNEKLFYSGGRVFRLPKEIVKYEVPVASRSKSDEKPLPYKTIIVQHLFFYISALSILAVIWLAFGGIWFYKWREEKSSQLKPGQPNVNINAIVNEDETSLQPDKNESVKSGESFDEEKGEKQSLRNFLSASIEIFNIYLNESENYSNKKLSENPELTNGLKSITDYVKINREVLAKAKTDASYNVIKAAKGILEDCQNGNEGALNKKLRDNPEVATALTETIDYIKNKNKLENDIRRINHISDIADFGHALRKSLRDEAASYKELLITTKKVDSNNASEIFAEAYQFREKFIGLKGYKQFLDSGLLEDNKKLKNDLNEVGSVANKFYDCKDVEELFKLIQHKSNTTKLRSTFQPYQKAADLIEQLGEQINVNPEVFVQGMRIASDNDVLILLQKIKNASKTVVEKVNKAIEYYETASSLKDIADDLSNRSENWFSPYLRILQAMQKGDWIDDKKLKIEVNILGQIDKAYYIIETCKLEENLKTITRLKLSADYVSEVDRLSLGTRHISPEEVLQYTNKYTKAITDAATTLQSVASESIAFKKQNPFFKALLLRHKALYYPLIRAGFDEQTGQLNGFYKEYLKNCIELSSVIHDYLMVYYDNSSNVFLQSNLDFVINHENLDELPANKYKVYVHDSSKTPYEMISLKNLKDFMMWQEFKVLINGYRL